MAQMLDLDTLLRITRQGGMQELRRRVQDYEVGFRMTKKRGHDDRNIVRDADSAHDAENCLNLRWCVSADLHGGFPSPFAHV